MPRIVELGECQGTGIGWGFGGSNLYLTKKYGASATGITVSPVRVQMAKEAAAKTNLDASFLLMGAETWWVDVAGPGDQCECPENRFPYLSDLLCATVPCLRVRLKWRFCAMARALYSLRS